MCVRACMRACMRDCFAQLLHSGHVTTLEGWFPFSFIFILFFFLLFFLMLFWSQANILVSQGSSGKDGFMAAKPNRKEKRILK